MDKSYSPSPPSFYNDSEKNDMPEFDNHELLLLLLILFIMFIRSWWEYYITRENSNTPLLSDYNDTNIEKRELTYTNDIYSDKECTICLEEFIENEKIYGLKCNHYYHKKCIDDWLKKRQTCPLCRLNLI